MNEDLIRRARLYLQANGKIPPETDEAFTVNEEERVVYYGSARGQHIEFEYLLEPEFD